MLYYGLCSFTLGSIVFSSFCPDLIKRFLKASDFFNETHVYYANCRPLQTIIEKIEEIQGGAYDDIYGLKSSIIARNAAVGPQQIHTLGDPMHVLHHVSDRRYFAARVIVFFCYAIGIVMLAIPTLFTFASVVRHSF